MGRFFSASEELNAALTKCQAGLEELHKILHAYLIYNT